MRSSPENPESARDLGLVSDRLIQIALEEDLGARGDMTTKAIFPQVRCGTANLIAKAVGTLSGIDIAEKTFKFVDSDLHIERNHQDGDHLDQKSLILSVTGSVASILTAERTALNFVGRLSGIATMTHQFVDRVRGTRAIILDTRKTTPGFRALEKYAVRCGGGENHRFGLDEMILIKDNHIAATASMAVAIRRCRDYMKQHGFHMPIEVEVADLDMVKEALAFRVDRIMLDNMSLDEMRAAVKLVDGQIPLEASGNVTLDTVSEIARTGVDYISVGSLTHSVKNLDVSLKVIA